MLFFSRYREQCNLCLSLYCQAVLYQVESLILEIIFTFTLGIFTFFFFSWSWASLKTVLPIHNFNSDRFLMLFLKSKTI